MNLPEKLKKIREQKKLSQSELAEKANVSQSMVAQIERGTKSPTVNLTIELAKALDVEVNELIC